MESKTHQDTWLEIYTDEDELKRRPGIIAWALQINEIGGYGVGKVNFDLSQICMRWNLGRKSPFGISHMIHA